MSDAIPLPDLHGSLLPLDPAAQAKLLSEVHAQVKKDMAPHTDLPDTCENLESLVAMVQKAVLDLYQHNMESLMQVVYRIDLNEHMVFNAIAEAANLEKACEHVSVLIIQRCLQKVLTRRAYS